MSLAATIVAYEAKPHTAMQKLILIALADFADEQGSALVDTGYLMEFSGATKEDVARAVRELVMSGFLTPHATENGFYTIIGVVAS